MHAAEVVTARRFVLIDEQGEARIELSASEGTVGLTIFGKGRSYGVVSVGVNQETGDPMVMVRRVRNEGEEGGGYSCLSPTRAMPPSTSQMLTGHSAPSSLVTRKR